MQRFARYFLGAIALIALWVTTVDAAGGEAEVVYLQSCAECHGADRLGGMGPALLPENLKRLKKKNAIGVISDGRPASQMPAFGEQLSKSQITALTDMIYTPLASVPEWGLAEIRQSQIVHVLTADLPAAPLHDADPLNLFTVVEAGDHHVTILDGDSFEPLWRFKSRFALHGGAKYSPDGRYVFLGSRDGWISKYDLDIDMDEVYPEQQPAPAQIPGPGGAVQGGPTPAQGPAGPPNPQEGLPNPMEVANVA